MTRTALLPALLLLMLSACGGGDASSDSAPEAEPLTKAEFTTQADEICAEGNQEIEAAAQDFPDSPSDEEIEQFANDTLIPNLQAQHEDIAALAPPEGDEEKVQAILDALQNGIDVVEEDPSSLLSSDDPLGEATDLARDYGLVECGA